LRASEFADSDARYANEGPAEADVEQKRGLVQTAVRKLLRE